MTSPVLLKLDGVGKSYPLGISQGERLGTLWALLRGRAAKKSFAALKDINLEIRRGESLGLIGENGAGKSTLLKIIAGVVRPTQGRVQVSGTVGALLELGAGFHPDYSGRDNVFLAASLMGLSRATIFERLDDIIAFADIGEHIDQPVKHYSSGMVVRLGFAVATAMRPEILITDEVLAVGDESFQKKCIRWMESYLADGGTLLLCSHSMFHVQKMCRKAAWIKNGNLHRFGESSEVAREYLAWHETRGGASRPVVGAKPVPLECYQIRSLVVNDDESDGDVVLAMGETLYISGTIHSPDGRTPNVALGLVRSDGSGIYGIASEMDAAEPWRISETLFGFALAFDRIPLLPGRYLVRAHAMDPEGLRLFDHVERTLDVTGSTREMGIVTFPHRWLSSPHRMDTTDAS